MEHQHLQSPVLYAPTSSNKPPSESLNTRDLGYEQWEDFFEGLSTIKKNISSGEDVMLEAV